MVESLSAIPLQPNLLEHAIFVNLIHVDLVDLELVLRLFPLVIDSIGVGMTVGVL